MSIKKLLLSALLLTTTGFAYAEDTTDPAKNYIKIGDDDVIVLVAGENKEGEGIVCINLENDKDWCAMQFDLYLPENVSVEDYDTTDRLIYKYKDAFGKEKTGEFNVEIAPQEATGAFRFVIYNGKNGKVEDGEGGDKAILMFKLTASDEANTGECYGYIKDAILASSYEGDGTTSVTGFNALDQETKFKIQINAKIGAGGYGSFSWPRDVVFGNDVEVFTATSEPKNGWLHLDPITDRKVPAGTGVFIKGTGSAIANPETTTEKVASVESTLGETSKEPFAAVSGTYALKTVEGKSGLHPVTSGTIPMYKAYVTSSSGAKFISFGDTATSIDALDMAEEEGDIYTLGGQKVQKTTMKGVYIKNGKKVVVK